MKQQGIFFKKRNFLHNLLFFLQCKNVKFFVYTESSFTEILLPVAVL